MDTFPNATPQSPGESAAAEHARRSVDEAHESAQAAGENASDTIRAKAARTRQALSQTTDNASHYVQSQPLKSLFMATAVGAAIAMVAGALSKRRHHSH